MKSKFLYFAIVLIAFNSCSTTNDTFRPNSELFANGVASNYYHVSETRNQVFLQLIHRDGSLLSLAEMKDLSIRIKNEGSTLLIPGSSDSSQSRTLNPGESIIWPNDRLDFHMQTFDSDGVLEVGVMVSSMNNNPLPPEMLVNAHLYDSI